MRSPCIGEREEPPPPPKEEREELQRCGHGLGIEEARGERHRMTRLLIGNMIIILGMNLNSNQTKKLNI